MSGNTKELNIGELSDELFILKELTWKIPKQKIRHNLLDHDVQSPLFSFAGSDWILHLYPYGCTAESISVGCIKIEIEKLDSKIPIQCIRYKSYFNTHRGKKFNPIHVTHTFNAGCKIGWLLLIQKESFFLDENIITTGDVLTFKCQMMTKKINKAEELSRKELEKIVAGMKERISRQDSLISTCECKEKKENVSRQDSVQSVSECKELTEKIPKQETPPLTPEYKEVEEKIPDLESPPLTPEYKDGFEDDKPPEKSEPPGFNRKDASVETDLEKPESSESSSKGCDCATRHPASFLNNKTLRDFKDLFISQEDCDVIINVKGQEFPAHRNILGARSPVFASTFRNDMKEKASGFVDVKDCDPNSFSDFLCFLYCGNSENLTDENVFSLFTTADKYDVQDLRTECLEYMKQNLSVNTFCDTITLAIQHYENKLIEYSTDFFAKNLQEIIVSVKWQSFIAKNPIQSNEIMIKALVPNKE